MAVYDFTLYAFAQDVANSLKEVLNYEGDVENDLCLTFQASVGQNDRVITEDLKKGSIDLTL